METVNKNFSIEKAVLEDIPQIVLIHKKCVLETNAKFYSDDIVREWIHQISTENTREQFKNSQWFVIKIKNEVIGFFQISLKEKTLYQINILSNYQGKGYGRLAYNFIERFFLSNNVKEINLNSTLNALSFYKRLGFKELEKINFKLRGKKLKMFKMKKNLIQKND
jgi:GNAT superfamily N-acetyltransferase